jgi:hypothetical protein
MVMHPCSPAVRSVDGAAPGRPDPAGARLAVRRPLAVARGDVDEMDQRGAHAEDDPRELWQSTCDPLSEKVRTLTDASDRRQVRPAMTRLDGRLDTDRAPLSEL